LPAESDQAPERLPPVPPPDAAARELATALERRRLTIGVAESLTGGLLVQALAGVEARVTG
jgi:Competence-damaged protein